MKLNNFSDFDELTYLELNPDVEAAVLSGAFSSGLEHWTRYGKAEGRLAMVPPTPHGAPEGWGEAAYLRSNPDVAAAVRNRGFRSGYDHWLASGSEEARPGGLVTHRKAAPRQVLDAFPFGFNCFGYNSAPTGLGSAVRGHVDVFRTLTSNVVETAVPVWGLEDRPEAGFDPLRIPFAFNIIHQNPDVLPLFLYHYSSKTLQDRINIACWVWELHAGYPNWHRLSRLFHEIWVPSRYVAEAISPISEAPLHVMPYLLDGLPASPTLTRSDLGLPESAFIFLYIFDLASTTGRKNPLALLRAFRKAFFNRHDVCLVLKYHNTASDAPGSATLQRLASECRNVRIFSQTMSANDIYGLVQIADCFVSPHRSEGFGLNMATAMYYGKPVIATGYSGNMDYMDENTAFLIDYDLVAVGPGHPHYRENYAWAEPSPDHLTSLLVRVLEAEELSRTIGLAGQAIVRSRFSGDAVAKKVQSRIDAITLGTV